MGGGVAGAIDHVGAAATRAELYSRLADWLSFPTPELLNAYESGELAAEARRLVDDLAYPFPLPLDDAALRGDDAAEIESEYIRLFDVPVGGSPVPLYGGMHGGDRRRVMEELLRFYRHFGLSTAGAAERDLPDWIPTVLEFLAYLCVREAAAPTAEEAAPYRTAQRDLLERNLNAWMPVIAGKLAKKEPTPLYRALVDLLGHFAAAEHSALSSV